MAAQHTVGPRHGHGRPLLRPLTVWQTMPGGWSRPVVIEPRICVGDVVKFAVACTVLLPVLALSAVLALGGAWALFDLGASLTWRTP